MSKSGAIDFNFLKGPIPDTICKCVIDGHEVTAIFHSDIHSDRWDEEEWVGPIFEVKCEDEATRKKVLAAWKHDEEIYDSEVAAGRRAKYSSTEGALEGMLGRMAGGSDKVDVVQEPDLFQYGILY